ncbi:MAG: rRNA maturation RNase YbeY [Pseudomonadota bacterium]
MKKRHKKKPKPLDYLDIEITLQEQRWMKVIPSYDEIVSNLAQRTLKIALADNLKSTLELSIVLANDEFIQKLNHIHRNKDQPTNVLAFPNLEDAQLALDTQSEVQPSLSLGDVVLAIETLEKEALLQHKSLIDHFSHLLVHGILHLLGFDHQTQTQADAMETLEIKILHSQGIKNPYALTNQTEEDTL